MEAEGLLESVEVPRGPRAHKREYRMTEQGLSVLRELASTPVEPAPEKDPYRLKAAYLEWLIRRGARASLSCTWPITSAGWRSGEKQEREIAGGVDAVVAERLAARPVEEHRAIVAAKVFAYQGMIARAKMEIEWARRGLVLLDELGE